MKKLLIPALLAALLAACSTTPLPEDGAGAPVESRSGSSSGVAPVTAGGLDASGLPRELTEVPGYSKWSVGVMAASIDHAPEKPARWPYVLVAGVFSLALLGQIAFRFRSELAITLPATRPALEALSQALNTDIPLPRHVELVSIEASDLQSDAARGNLLALNATVRNRAAYPQAYPALELALTDTQDTPIVRRVFRPEEYLPATLRADQPFPAHSDIAVRLWIEAKEVSAHAGCPRMSSGQLPFLGLKLLALGGALLDTLVHEVVVRRCFVQEEAVPDPVGGRQNALGAQGSHTQLFHVVAKAHLSRQAHGLRTVVHENGGLRGHQIPLSCT